MKLKICFGLLAVAISSFCSAADTAIGSLSSASAVSGSDVVPIVQSGTTKKATATQLATYTRSVTTKSDVALANVENTALSTWAGSTNLTTLANGAVTDDEAALLVKPAVTVVATSNQANSGLLTVDGVTTADGSIVLDTAQSTGSQNGPWVVHSGAWTRPTWYNAGSTQQGLQFSTTLVRLGTTYQGSTWRLTTAAPITIDTTATTWTVTPLTLNTTTTTGIGSAVQAWDADLDAIAALAPSNDDLIQRKAGAWVNRTIAQYKTDLAFPLSGTTGSIGGGALLAGACTSGTVSVTSSTTAMAVVASPVTYPGDGAYWMGYVSTNGTVTVKVCAAVALTPTSSAYNVRVIQ